MLLKFSEALASRYRIIKVCMYFVLHCFDLLFIYFMYSIFYYFMYSLFFCVTVTILFIHYFLFIYCSFAPISLFNHLIFFQYFYFFYFVLVFYLI